ncbi:MAG: tyrosine-type recombinase/integrase [Clostridia bacterium]|nr:tyrosine-type recombinase/integrase [Clostridia bacterium]
MRLEEAMNNFLDYHEAKGSSPKTIIYYRDNISRLIEFLGDKDVNSITIEALRSYIVNLKNRKRHVNNVFYIEDESARICSISLQTYIRAVRAFLAWLYKENYIITNFHPLLPLPRATKKQVEILSNEHIDKICRSLDTHSKTSMRNITMFFLILDTGIRLSEAIGLKVEDVDLHNFRMKVLGKGDKERTVFFGSKTKAFLKRYIENFRGEADCNNVFLSGAEPMTENAVKNVFRRISKKTGIEVHAHLLRHTFATKFLIAGGNVFELQMLMGHTTLAMTQKYVHLASVYNTQTRRLSIMDSLVT